MRSTQAAHITAAAHPANWNRLIHHITRHYDVLPTTALHDVITAAESRTLDIDVPPTVTTTRRRSKPQLTNLTSGQVDIGRCPPESTLSREAEHKPSVTP